MAGRPPSFVSIGLEEVSRLVITYLAAVAEKEKIGECNSDKPVKTVLAEINMQSQIRITPKQLENLVYHYKQVVMEKVDPAKTQLTLTEKEYQTMLKRIKLYCPNLIKTNRLGELVFINFEDEGES